jgi:hypothetical protein
MWRWVGHCVVCPQAAAASAEAQVSSLEAALQQGSAATLEMTEKVAHTLATSSSQVDALKAQLVESESQLLAAKQAASDARGEAQAAQAALSAAQHKRRSELAALRQQHAAELDTVRAREHLGGTPPRPLCVPHCAATHLRTALCQWHALACPTGMPYARPVCARRLADCVHVGCRHARALALRPPSCAQLWMPPTRSARG